MDATDRTRVVVALGGNAIVTDSGDDYETRVAAVREVARDVASLPPAYECVFTHGNGPQVGNRLLEQEGAETPPMPLSTLVAETQGQIGTLLVSELDAALDREAVSVVTHVRVDADDPAFEDPSKPIGPFYTESEAGSKPFETRRVGTGDRPYRRVVASPRPERVLEAAHVQTLLGSGAPVVCGGGGGVPVVEREGRYDPCDAVVDKDYTSRLLATRLDADELVFLTDVRYAYANYGTDDADPLLDPSVEDLRRHRDAGEFGRGSMRPKVDACIEFLEAGGDRAVVASVDELAAAIEGEAGTQVT